MDATTENSTSRRFMRRATLSISGRAYELAPEADLASLKEAIRQAVGEGGRFVDVNVVGTIVVSVLASPGVPILLTSRDVDDDTGDVGPDLAVVEWKSLDQP
jgi:hypothetical protein